MSTTPTPGPSRSERGIGARLSKARDIITLLGSFSPAYAPGHADLATTALNTLHIAADKAHTIAVEAKHAEKAATDARKGLFGKAGRGVLSRLSDIRKAVLAAYGKDSPQYRAADRLIDQMQGAAAAGTSPAQTSFASTTQAYADLIDTVNGFGADYAPAKADVQPVALAAHLGEIRQANTVAAANSAAARAAEDERNEALALLAQRLERAKAAVSSQYDYGSAQEKAVRKLKV